MLRRRRWCYLWRFRLPLTTTCCGALECLWWLRNSYLVTMGQPISPKRKFVHFDYSYQRKVAALWTNTWESGYMCDCIARDWKGGSNMNAEPAERTNLRMADISITSSYLGNRHHVR